MTTYRIQIDQETCIGDKLCCETAPGTFAVDDEGRVYVRDPLGDPPEDVLAAAQCCRLEAITLLEHDSGRQAWPRP